MSEFEARQRAFRENLCLWIVVHHFLSADLVRELCAAVVSKASEDTLSLEGLVGDYIATESPSLANWGVRPRTCEGPLAAYLWRFIQVVIWQGDELPGLHDPQEQLSQYTILPKLELSLELAHTDFSAAAHVLPSDPDRLPEELRPLVEAMRTAIGDLNSKDPLRNNSIDWRLGESDATPLSAILTKHLGDLYGDADRWQVARNMYQRAETLLAQCTDPAWASFSAALSIIFKQSLAAATRTTQGAADAIDILRDIVTSEGGKGHILVPMNAIPDYLTAHFALDRPQIISEKRGATLLAPQLINSHHTAHALSSWRDKKFDSAHRWFWAVLRRQIALGSATYSRDTKAHYGCSLIDLACEKLDQNDRTSTFAMGVRLLVESGRNAVVEKIEWKEALVERYVTEKAVEDTVSWSRNAEGALSERATTVITLFSGWLRSLPADRHQTTSAMIRYLSEAAQRFTQSTLADRNIRKAALESLRRVGIDRPEFLRLCAPAVAGAIRASFEGLDPLLQAEAMQTALVYIDDFDDRVVEDVVTRVTVLTQKLERGDGPGFVIDPALQLLSSKAVTKRATINPEIRKRAMEELLRLSLEVEAASTNIMYLLRWLDPQFAEGKVESERLKTIVEKLCKSALQINSSGAVSNIHALLAAPGVAGMTGVATALTGLRNILETASTGRPSISFTDAYHSLIFLSNHRADLVNGLSLKDEEIVELLSPLFAPLVEMWRAAASAPLIFAGFAFPPRTSPNSTLVHNWTFASLGFARSLSRLPEMLEAMEGAAHHPDLQKAISVAKSVRVSAGDPEDFDEAKILHEGHDAFYAALGSRLIGARNLMPDQRVTILSILLKLCFRFGPDGMDSGLFLSALEHQIPVNEGSPDLIAYIKRLRNNRALRLNLYPILRELLSEEVLNDA